jgi:phage shock protein PspC (stress-responsive transcriptional regulator)
MGLADELERLQALRERGALSEGEYERAKAKLLGQTAPPAEGAAAAGPSVSPLPDARPFASETAFFRQLARSRSDRWLGGVCGGLGRHTQLPSWAWRLIFCLVSLYFGSGILFYLLLWLFLPAEA